MLMKGSLYVQMIYSNRGEYVCLIVVDRHLVIFWRLVKVYEVVVLERMVWDSWGWLRPHDISTL